jgi:hypothetical protein
VKVDPNDKRKKGPNAGAGKKAGDEKKWAANTTSPTPIFTHFIINILHKEISQKPIFIQVKLCFTVLISNCIILMIW